MSEHLDFTLLRNSNARKEDVIQCIKSLRKEVERSNDSKNLVIDELEKGGFSPLSRNRIFDMLISDFFDERVEKMILNIAFGDHSSIKSSAQDFFVKLSSPMAISHAMMHCSSDHLTAVKYKTSTTRLHAEVAFDILSRHGNNPGVVEIFLDGLQDENTLISSYAFDYFPQDQQIKTTLDLVATLIDFVPKNPFKVLTILIAIEVDGENGLLCGINTHRDAIASAIESIQLSEDKSAFWDRCIRRNISHSIFEMWTESITEIKNGFLPASLRRDLLNSCPELIQLSDLDSFEMIKILELVEEQFSDCIDRKSDDHVRIQNQILQKLMLELEDFSLLKDDRKARTIGLLVNSDVFVIKSQPLVDMFLGLLGDDTELSDYIMSNIFPIVIRFIPEKGVEKLVNESLEMIRSNRSSTTFAYDVIGNLGTEKEIEALISILKVPAKWRVNYWPRSAIQSIGQIGGESAFHFLAQGLRNEGNLEELSQAFDKGPVNPMDFLLRVVMNGYPFSDPDSISDIEVRLNACWVIADIGKNESINEIQKATENINNDWIKKHLLKSIKCIEGNRDILKYFRIPGKDASFTAEFYTKGQTNSDDFDGAPGPLR